ncbi:MAG: rubrerythrin [Actinobacteria bacterium]|nr:rubrerythrin [Actinomycetota bacterium]
MNIWKCGLCGLLIANKEAPGGCTVCGASSDKFKTTETSANILGSATENNLKRAFAGESQVNRRYLLFAKIAEQEGDEIAEDLFLKFAYEETWHALSHLLYLRGAKTTMENILESIEGESYEARKMYKDFEAKAREEGFDDIAKFFGWLSKAEGRHSAKFKEYLEMRGSE